MKIKKGKSKKTLGMKQKQKQKQTVKQSVNLKLMAGAPSAPGGYSGYAAPIIIPSGYGPESIDAKIALWEMRRAGINVNDRDPEKKNNAEDAFNKISVNPVYTLAEEDQNRYNAINGNLRYNQYDEQAIAPQVKQEPVVEKKKPGRPRKDFPG